MKFRDYISEQGVPSECPQCGKKLKKNALLGSGVCNKCKRMFYPKAKAEKLGMKDWTKGIPVPTGR